MLLYDMSVTVTHEPTGESVTVTSQITRSQFHARRIALEILRSRVYAFQQGINRSDREVAIYDLPGDNPYPHELGEFKNLLLP